MSENQNSQAAPQVNQVRQVQPQVQPPPVKKTEAALAAEEQATIASVSPAQAQEVLIRSLLEREARLAKKELEEEEKNIVRAKQRALNAKNRNEKLFLKQSRCKHLKGGKVKSKTGVKDYALFHHTYIDRTQLIGCFICKMRWRPGDTEDVLLRNGRRIRNHTRIGWAGALALFEESSNSPTSSEIPTPPAEQDPAYGEDLGAAEAQ
jgi:hypothetical protein